MVVYGNDHEMTASSMDESIHSTLSYRNMTHNPDTILVLMDATEDLVRQGVRAVNAARPGVEQMGPTMMCKTINADLNYNERCYNTCLRKSSKC